MNPDMQQQPGAPAPAPQPMATPPSPAPMGGGQPMPMAGKPANKNMMMGIIIGAVVVVAAIAWGVYAYVSNTPESMLQSAVQNISGEKTMAATLKIVSGTGNSKSTFTGDVAVAVDPKNEKNGEVILGIGSGDQRIGLSVLSLDESFYLKGTELERLGALFGALNAGASPSDVAELSTAFKNLNGQWFVMTKEEIQQVAQSSGTDSVSGAVSPAEIKKMLEIYTQHPFIVSDKVFADETVDGSNSAHFSLKVDKDKEVAFLQAVKAANLTTITVTDQDIAEAKSATQTADSTIEVWIARDSKKFKQIRIANTKAGEETDITLTLTGKLPTFDKFEKPAGAKPIAQLMNALLGAPLPQDDFSDL